MKTILLVDDAPYMAALVQMCVEDFEVKVVQVPDLTQALVAAQLQRPRLILLDLSLGDEDGMTMLSRLRQEPSLSDVPVVVFSVHDSRKGEALQKGAADFVAKPFQVEQLWDRLRPYLPL